MGPMTTITTIMSKITRSLLLFSPFLKATRNVSTTCSLSKKSASKLLGFSFVSGCTQRGRGSGKKKKPYTREKTYKLADMEKTP